MISKTLRYLLLPLLLSICSPAFTLFAAEMPAGKILPVWVGDAPGDEGREDKEQVKDNRIYSLVHRPTIEVFLTGAKGSPQSFLLICPGGGYNVLEYDKEGLQVAKRFLQAGMSVGILKYRTARWGEDKD